MRILMIIISLLISVTLCTASELHQLVFEGDNAKVQAILEKNPELIDQLDAQHRTPLYMAAENGKLELARLLLSFDANITIGDNDNSQPIHLAAIGGYTNVLELLITKGADINARDNNGTTALIFAISYRKPETALWLIEHEADYTIANNRGATPLHYAVARGSADLMNHLLDQGADIDAADGEGETVLHYAAQAGELEMTRLLLKYNPNLEKRNIYGRTPLLLTARESGDPELARLLADKGADINAEDKSNDTPLTLAAWRGFKSMVNLLLDRGARLPIDHDFQAKLLNRAADNGLTRLFCALQENGADINIKSETGGTLLHQACCGGADSIVLMLIEKGFDLNALDKYGRTPLHYSAEKGHIEIAQLFISNGADTNIRSLSGRSPFNVAIDFNRNSFADILRQNSVDTSAIEFPKLEGPYLGQNLKTGQPEMFAPDIVSTNQFEHGCLTLTPDGREIYWTTSIVPDGDIYAAGFIMTSRLENGYWTIPQIAEFSGTDMHDDIPVISPDGTRLYFLSRRDGGGGMMYVEKEEDRWSEPRLIQGGPNKLSPYWQFSVTNNHDIYFASRGDIYISKFMNGAHTDPYPIDSLINAPADEGHPCVAPDESFLIFRTHGYPDSLGGDGFRISYRNEDGVWSTSKKLKYQGKSLQGICPVLSPEGKYLFFNGLGTGITDIYWIYIGSLDIVG